VLKRAADLAEALYSMPRNPNQISLPPPRSPAINNSSPMSSFNTYTGQLAVSVQDPGGQWEEGMYNIVLCFSSSCVPYVASFSGFNTFCKVFVYSL